MPSGKAGSRVLADRPLYGRGTGTPHPVDIHVGARIRQRRLLLGMNQETLARALDLTFQQVQKYERGANRVSASRLVAIAEVLKAPVAYFFAGAAVDEATADAEERLARERMHQPETLELIRLYYSINDPRVRNQFLEMVKSIAAKP